MHIRDMNWMQVEDYLKGDDRAVLPIGSTEQHAQLSLMVDAILSERVAVEAAAPLDVPVFPTVCYGLTPYFTAYPGTVTLRLETLIAVVRDILDSLRKSGFRRIMIVNGHGGNVPVGAMAREYMTQNPGCFVRYHDWFRGNKVWAKIMETDPVASHASWMENFPWTRLPDVATPEEPAPMLDHDRLILLDAKRMRAYAGDGNWGGDYRKSDEDMQAIWDVAVAETRELLNGPWPE